jgi:hypothetical protein
MPFPFKSVIVRVTLSTPCTPVIVAKGGVPHPSPEQWSDVNEPGKSVSALACVVTTLSAKAVASNSLFMSTPVD